MKKRRRRFPQQYPQHLSAFLDPMKKAVAAFLEKKAANSNEIGIGGGGGVRLEKEDFGRVPALVAVAVASPFDFAVMSRLLLEGARKCL